MENTQNEVLIYEVKFNEPKYNATYTFIRRKSGAFAYGNQTAVDIYRNDEFKDSYDTRYDGLVMKDFAAWCEDYLSCAFRKDLEPTWGQPMMPMPGTLGKWFDE